MSALGHIFVTPPRQAESADARMDIRRRDQDAEGRKNKKREPDDDAPFDMEDTATVSVEALQVFLTNFIKEQKSEDAAKKAVKQLNLEENFKAGAGKPSSPVNAPAAKAANAYQSSSQMNTRGAMLQTSDADGDGATIPTVSLDNKELRQIYSLLEKIQTLKTRGVGTLRIEREDSFLASLENAADRALEQSD